MATLQLRIEGMTCAGCVSTLEQALSAVEGVEHASVSLVTRSAQITYQPQRCKPNDLISAVNQAGYQGFAMPSEPMGTQRKSSRYPWPLIQLSLCGLMTLVVMSLSWLPIHLPFHAYWLWGLSTVVLIVGGGGILVKTIRALTSPSPLTMDTLLSLSILSTYGLSIWTIQQMKGLSSWTFQHVPFEMMCFLITVVLLGRFLEARARHKTGELNEALLRLQPGQVKRVSAEGDANADDMIPLDQVQVGDCVRIAPGDAIPVDGTVESGISDVNEALITGEAIPQTKQLGDTVTSGTINLSQPLIVRVSCTPDESFLHRLTQHIQQAQYTKAPIQGWADTLTHKLVLVVLIIALLTLVIWLACGYAFSFALIRTISVLMLACPCALGLATPTALAVGMGRAGQRGILIKQSKALETACELDTLVFDKTGTLTMGYPEVTGIDVSSQYSQWSVKTIITVAASAEQSSNHPIADALYRAAKQHQVSLLPISDARSLPGQGIGCVIDGSSVWIGKPSLLGIVGVETDNELAQQQQLRLQRGETLVVVIVNMKWVGLIGLKDALRDNAKETLGILKGSGLRLVMMTGDNEASAQWLVTMLGKEMLSEVHSELAPEDKLELIKTMQANGAKVAMIGDGLNDAPALAQAQIGIALGTSVEATNASADVVMLHGRLDTIGELTRLSQAVLNTIKTNTALSLAYNLIGIPLAAGVLYPWTQLALDPHISGLAMAASSLVVTFNSLRLWRWQP